jgi:adenosylcobyric acid synthase
MNREKTTWEAAGELLASSLFGTALETVPVRGYEIHIGETQYLEGSAPFAKICRRGDALYVLDGCINRNGRVIGTYLHGIFHEDVFRHAFLQAARRAYLLEPAGELLDWKRLREAELDRLAQTVAESVDMKRLLGFVGLNWPIEESVCAQAR